MIRFKIKSLDRDSILLYKIFIENLLNELNLAFSTTNIPRRKLRITLLKSPHVNKKSREQFQFTNHQVIFCIVPKVNAVILKYVILNKPKTVKIALSSV